MDEVYNICLNRSMDIIFSNSYDLEEKQYELNENKNNLENELMHYENILKDIKNKYNINFNFKDTNDYLNEFGSTTELYLDSYGNN